MAQLPADEAIARLKQNEDRFDKFVNEATGYTSSGGQYVESLAEFLSRIDATYASSFVSLTDPRFGGSPGSLIDTKTPFKLAIAHLQSVGGGILFVPPGQYLFSTYDSHSHVDMMAVENIYILGYGAKFISTLQDSSRFFFRLDGCRNITFDGFEAQGTFARSLSVTTTPGVGLFSLRSSARDSNNINVRNVRAYNIRTWMGCSLDNPSYRVRGITVDNCFGLDGYYGINFQNNGDLLFCRGFRTTRFIRTYFPYGVDNHDVQYTSMLGDVFTDCLIKAYSRDTTNIKVKAKIIGNTSNDSHVTLESQHAPATQATPAVLRNIDLDIDDTESGGTGPSLRFAYFQDTPSPVETATCSTALFDVITVRGRGRQHIQFAVTQPADSGLLDLRNFSYNESGTANAIPYGFYHKLSKNVRSDSTSILYTTGSTPAKLYGGVQFLNYSGVTQGYQDGTIGLAELRFETNLSYQFRKNNTSGAGTLMAAFLSNNSSVFGVKFYDGANTGAPSAADAVVKIGQMNATGRSLSAAGTLNASGADYAEYEFNNGLHFKKGDIVGFRADGTLTDRFSEALRFGVKSTNPCLVGGDVWCSVPEPDPVVRRMPVVEQHVDPDGLAHEVLVDAGETDEEWALREGAYMAAVRRRQEAVEVERAKVDRVAYSGKAPCNVLGAEPGGYILASEGDDGRIIGEFVRDPDFTQYKRAVGRVNRVLDDGRAEIAVIVH